MKIKPYPQSHIDKGGYEIHTRGWSLGGCEGDVVIGFLGKTIQPAIDPHIPAEIEPNLKYSP
jgi:hypothetical protein